MKKIIVFLLTVTILLSAGAAMAQDKATPQDVYDMVLRAYEVIKQLGEDGLPAFNDPKGEFVFKDSYVYVMQCPEYVVAHPFALDKLKGVDQRPITPFHNRFCEAAKDPNGRWIEYEWPKPGETEPSRKIGFVINVEGTPYQVAGGIYDDEISVEELNKGLK